MNSDFRSRAVIVMRIVNYLYAMCFSFYISSRLLESLLVFVAVCVGCNPPRRVHACLCVSVSIAPAASGRTFVSLYPLYVFVFRVLPLRWQFWPGFQSLDRVQDLASHAPSLSLALTRFCRSEPARLAGDTVAWLRCVDAFPHSLTHSLFLLEQQVDI